MPNNTPELTRQEVIARGGWHPTYALVLALASDEDVAVALVAGNGLGYEMEIEMWGLADDKWTPMHSFGLAPRPGGHASGSGGGAAYAAGLGDAAPGQRVLVAYADDVVELATNDNGAWAWIKRAENPFRWGDPEVVLG